MRVASNACSLLCMSCLVVACTGRAGFDPYATAGGEGAGGIGTVGDNTLGPQPGDADDGDVDGGDGLGGGDDAPGGDAGGDELAPIPCAHNDECDDVCVDGWCTVPGPTGSACDDHFDCVVPDMCQGGVCVGCVGATEVCDGIDNNCNGMVNEGCAVSCAHPSLLGDGFDDGVIGSLWGSSLLSTGGTTSESGGRLTLSVTGAVGSLARYSSDHFLDLRGSAVLVELLDFAADATSHLRFRVGDVGFSSIHNFMFDVRAGQLYARHMLDGAVLTEQAVDYVPNRHRWLRIREAAGTLFWEVSPDGTHFGLLMSMAAPTAVIYQRVTLEMETFAPGAGGYAVVDNFNGDGGGNVARCPASAVVDDFDDGVLSKMWSYSVVNSGTAINEGGGVIELVPPTNGTAYCHLISANTYDLRDSAASVRVLAVPGGSAQAMFYLFAGNQSLRFMVQEGTLRSIHEVGGSSTTIAQSAYNPATEPYLRIRETAGVVYWETSSDGISFNVEASMAAPIDVSGLRVSLVAGAWEPVASPGRALFDDVNITP